MFLKIFCLYVVVVCAFAAPPTDVVPLEKQQPTVIPIVSQSEELEANGTFKYSYETANGIKREEVSYDKVLPHAKSASSIEGESQSDESNEIHVQQGSYSYTAPDGTVITVRYIADENGFRPIGDHLPKPPSILIAASPARISGRKPKTADNVKVGSAPAPVIAYAPAVKESAKALAINKALIQSETPKVALRIAESSAEQASNPASEGSQESSNTEVPSITKVPSTAELPLSTTESAATQQSLSSEITSTEQPTTEAVPTPEQSTTDQLPSSPADSTSDATPAASTSDTTPAASTSDATLPDTTTTASITDATPAASTPNPTTPDATPAASTPEATTPNTSTAASTTDATTLDDTPAASTSDASTPDEKQATSTTDSTTPDASQSASTPDSTPDVSNATPA